MDDTIFITSSATNCGLIAVSFSKRASANIFIETEFFKTSFSNNLFNLGSEEQSTIAIFVLLPASLLPDHGFHDRIEFSGIGNHQEGIIRLHDQIARGISTVPSAWVIMTILLSPGKS